MHGDRRMIRAESDCAVGSAALNVRKRIECDLRGVLGIVDCEANWGMDVVVGDLAGKVVRPIDVIDKIVAEHGFLGIVDFDEYFLAIVDLEVLGDQRVGVGADIANGTELVTEVPDRKLLEADQGEFESRVVAIKYEARTLLVRRAFDASQDRRRRIARDLLGAGRIPAATEIERLVVLVAGRIEDHVPRENIGLGLQPNIPGRAFGADVVGIIERGVQAVDVADAAYGRLGAQAYEQESRRQQQASQHKGFSSIVP